MKTIAFASLAILAAAPALANTNGFPTLPPVGTAVPEIDATAGVAAMAALGASIAMLRERFKR